MKRFEVGKTYYMFSPCDQDCRWCYTVLGRTALSVLLMDESGNTVRRRISRSASEGRRAEIVFPIGFYSMAPVLSADRLYEAEGR